MIIDAIVNILFAVLQGVLGLLPVLDLPAGLTVSASGLGDGLATANTFFPVTTLGTCLGIVLAVRLFLFAWDFLVWLYDKVPFKAT